MQCNALHWFCFLAPSRISRSHNLLLISIILAQVSLRSLLGYSQVFLRSLSLLRKTDGA